MVTSKHNLIEILMKLMSKINITNLGRPDLPKGNAKVFEPPCSEVTVDNTPGTGVSSLPNDDRMLLEEEKWSKIFGNSKDFKNF